MVLDTARPKVWSTWKRCCNRFVRDTVYRESQLAIGRTEHKSKEWDELAQEDHTYHHTPEEQKRYQGQWYLAPTKQAKMGLRNFDLNLEALSRLKIVYTTNQQNKLKSVFVVGQVWMELEVRSSKFFKLIFVTVGFAYSR